MFRYWITASAVVGACSRTSAAQAQSSPNPGGSTIVTATVSSSLDFTPETQVAVQQSLSVTELIGRLNHGAILYDHTFNAAFGTPIVQAGVTAAIAAITSAGGPGVVITGPTLISHNVTTASTSNSIYSLDPSSQDPVTHQPVASRFVVTTTSVFGPTTIPGTIATLPGQPDLGVLNHCNVETLPSTTRPTCVAIDPGSMTVLAGQLDININTESIFTIDTTTTTTTTTTTSEVYDIDGMTVRGIGTVHGAAAEAGFDQGDRFGRRLLDAGLDHGAGDAWAEGYGYWVHSGAAGDFPGDRRHGQGINGGFGHDLGGGVRLGAAFDYGTSTINETSAGEFARLRLAQLGLHGAWRSGRFYASLAGTYGWGNIATSVTPVGIMTTASSRYRLSTADVSTEAGYRLAAHGFALTPSLGAALQRLHADGFTEVGSLLALAGQTRSYDRNKAWLGLTVETDGGRVLDLRAYGRAVAFGGDRRVEVPVSFVGSTTPLTIDGPDTGRYGADLGAAIVWHLGPRVEAYGAYDARLRERYSAQTGSVGVRISL